MTETSTDPVLIDKLVELSRADFELAVEWVLNELGPEAFEAPNGELEMAEDDKRLEGRRYQAFAFLVPNGAAAAEGTRHWLVQEALSARLGVPVWLTHDDELEGSCRVMVSVIPVPHP